MWKPAWLRSSTAIVLLIILIDGHCIRNGGELAKVLILAMGGCCGHVFPAGNHSPSFSRSLTGGRPAPLAAHLPLLRFLWWTVLHMLDISLPPVPTLVICFNFVTLFFLLVLGVFLFCLTSTPGGLTTQITTVVNHTISPLMFPTYWSGLPILTQFSYF